MNSFLQIINTVTGSIRFIIGMFVVCILGLALIITIGAGVVAPRAVEEVAERAESAHNREIEAARKDARNRSYSAEGWGYDDGSADPVERGSLDPEGEEVGGWGN